MILLLPQKSEALTIASSQGLQFVQSEEGI